jgi:hypothetical protein
MFLVVELITVYAGLTAALSFLPGQTRNIHAGFQPGRPVRRMGIAGLACQFLSVVRALDQHNFTQY